MNVVLDGASLTIEQLASIARDPSVTVDIDPKTEPAVRRSEAAIARVVAQHREAYAQGGKISEYGVTTGFGEFKDKPIAPDDLEQLQRNLLLSHSVGVGDNSDPDDLANYYPAEVVRGALATRLNAFLKGRSGVRMRLVEIVRAMLNRGVIPLVPLRGSVGASGDLCPLSHLFATLLGEGRFYTTSDRTLRSARELPEVLGFSADELKPTFKEGLGLVNGANFSAAMLALAVYDAERLADHADAAAALSLEALAGCTRALDPKVHAERGHPGQIESAQRIGALLAGSRLVERAGAVQDPYSLRCAPQVHGATRDTLRFVRATAERELNAATDNPLFFPDEGDPFDLQFRANWPEWYHGDRRLAYSAGNFHGQPLALAADFLTIAIHELGNISERRTQLMLDGHHNRGLPQNLTTRPGVNSGLMILQYTAASIVSENKVLAHPASVDSIPTGANTEDHVSMSTHAARKLRTVLSNVQSVLAIELLAAAQAVEWRAAFDIDPNKPTKLANEAEANAQAQQFEAAVRDRANEIAAQLGEGTRALYLTIRSAARPVFYDRPLDGDIRAVRRAIGAP
ncbi:MAG: histidine ammonia-lyase [Acidobacteria bacterium]|nr:histidine ammonia-lyase [Acidobacteriota bacterium]MBV9477988.1 histidine ammonia-lyase [Acidobacteriota bacterium]